MTRFLKSVFSGGESSCPLCALYTIDCLMANVLGCDENCHFILGPRPPDGTRCRDLEGNVKVVGRDV
jgi:hypothetical protein